MAISTMSVGELTFGTERSEQSELNQADIGGMLARLDVFNFDKKAA